MRESNRRPRSLGLRALGAAQGEPDVESTGVQFVVDIYYPVNIGKRLCVVFDERIEDTYECFRDGTAKAVEPAIVALFLVFIWYSLLVLPTLRPDASFEVLAIKEQERRSVCVRDNWGELALQLVHNLVEQVVF